MPQLAAKRLSSLLVAVALATALAACASTVSTSSFKGAQHEVAQTISDLQADATASDQKKVCGRDLAAAVVTRLGGKAGCERSIKQQLNELDSLETSVSSIQLAGATKATASVKSIYSGKKRTHTVSLVKEGSRWKVAAIS
jgi:hypothetical protein